MKKPKTSKSLFKTMSTIIASVALCISVSLTSLVSPTHALNNQSSGTTGTSGQSGSGTTSNTSNSAGASSTTDVCSASGVPQSVKDAAGCSGNTDANFRGAITGILNVVIAASSLVAVVFVIIGGVNYMTSSGDSNKLEKARKTILYAVIGMVICALSFAIVNWAIGAIGGSSGGDSNSSESDSSQSSS